MKSVVRLIFRFRIPVLAVAAALTVFFAWNMRSLRVNSDVISYLPKTDPAVELFNHVGDAFGGNDLALVAVRSDSLFSYGTLSALRDLTGKVKTIPRVSSVMSLTDVLDIRSGADNSVEIAKLIDADAIPRSADSLAAVRKYTMSKERYQGTLISKDGTATMIIIQLAAGSDRAALIDTLRGIVNDAHIPGKVYLGGAPVLIQEIASVIFSDLTRLIPLVSILIILTLMVSFGTIRGVVIPLVAVLMSTIWTLGTMAILNVPLTIISDIIPVLLIAIGTAPSIHILSKYDEDLARYGSTGEQAQSAFAEVGWRVLLAGATIVLGFSSFIFGSYLTMIRDFGIFSSLGVVYTLVISLIVIPSVLTFLHPHKRAGKKGAVTGSAAKATFVAGLMEKTARIVTERKTSVFCASAILLLCGIWGAPRIERKVDIIDYFKDNSSMKITENVIEHDFGGSRPVYIHFKGDMQSPAVLKEMIRVEKALKARGVLGSPLSVADLIEEMNDIMEGRKAVPESRDKVVNLYFLLEGQDILSRLVTSDRSEGLVQGMVGMMDVRKLRETVSAIDSITATVDPAVARVSHTGMPVVYQHLDKSLIESQVQSFGIALIVIFAILALQLRSIIGGITGLTPILLTVILMFGIMGVGHIPLDIATVLTAAIALGIGIDYAIHFSVRYRQYHRVGESSAPAIAMTLETTGKAILINALAVTMGFITLFFAQLVPLQRFGGLVAITMVGSALGAITLLPSLIMILKDRFVKSSTQGGSHA